MTFTASITRALGTDPTPTGTVDFYFDSVTPANKIGATKTLSGVTGTGTATSDPISTLTIGTHTIIAVYTSTNSFQDSTTGLSLTLSQRVNNPTTTVVTASSGRTYFGEPVIYTATVSGPGGTPTGTVNFFTGTGVFLGAGTLSGGVAQISTGAVPPGVNTIQAVYVGDATSPDQFRRDHRGGRSGAAVRGGLGGGRVGCGDGVQPVRARWRPSCNRTGRTRAGSRWPSGTSTATGTAT